VELPPALWPVSGRRRRWCHSQYEVLQRKGLAGQIPFRAVSNSGPHELLRAGRLRQRFARSQKLIKNTSIVNVPSFADYG